MGNTKDFGGISSPFGDAICPVPGGSGASATDIGGVSIPDGQKGVSGEMPQVNGVSLEGDSSPGMKRPSGMAGS